jgi:hypothetical protein
MFGGGNLGSVMSRTSTRSLARRAIATDDETDVDREIASNLWRHHRMLPPNSRFRHYWDYSMVCLVLYNLILTPMQLGYFRSVFFADAAIPFFVVDVMMWLAFVIDIVVNFRTSFYDEDHQIVLSAKVVAARYRSGWFMYDLLASLPYHLVGAIVTFGLSGGAHTLTVAICKIPICMRLGRIWRKLDEISSVGYFRVVLQMLGFIMVAHWVACLWWMIGETTYDASTGETSYQGKSWLLRVPEGSTKLDTNLTVTPFSQQYMSSLYWSLTTLMKTPWVGPDTVEEKIFASLMVVLGATLFAMLLGNVTAMINTYNKRHSELRDQLTTLHTFAHFRRVPAHLQRKVCRCCATCAPATPPPSVSPWIGILRYLTRAFLRATTDVCLRRRVLEHDLRPRCKQDYQLPPSTFARLRSDVHPRLPTERVPNVA